MKDMASLMREAQKMQAKISEAQGALEALEIEGSAGAGLVKVRLKGSGEAIGVDIDDSLIKADEKGVLEDLIAAALNDAKRKLEAAQKEAFSGAAGDLGSLMGGGSPFG